MRTTTLVEPRAAIAPAELERWESWPLWAIGLSNGLNIALWYVLSMVRVPAPELALRLPALVNAAMPWLIVAGALASALSLDGVLIATIAGVRHGRRSRWSYATIVGAGLFSALIVYAVHSGLLAEWSWLHVAQALVLVLYNLHLSQPRKGLTHALGSGSRVSSEDAPSTDRLRSFAAARPSEKELPLQPIYPAPVMVDLSVPSKIKPCKHCGRKVTFQQAGQHGRNVKRYGVCVRP